MKKGPIAASILLGAILVAGAIMFGDDKPQTVENVTMEGSSQIIDIRAKGGYSPKITNAQAGVPTILRVKTDGTYDCSSAITIPKLGYSKVLESAGVVDIPIPAQEAGSTLQGMCSMGMYNFSVTFL